MQINVIFKDIKDVGVMIGIISPWNCQVLCLQRLEGIWKVTADSFKSDQVAADTTIGRTVNTSWTRLYLCENRLI